MDKKEFLQSLENMNLTIEDLTEKFTYKNYKVAWEDSSLYIEKDGEIIFCIADFSIRKIYVSYNEDLALLDISCMEDIDTESDHFIFSFEKEKFIQFYYLNKNLSW